MIRKLISRVRLANAYKVIEPLVYTPDLKQSYSTGSVVGGTLKGKNAAIVGATGGIGKAVAERFIKEGCLVVLIGRNEKKLSALQKELGFEKVTSVVLDISSPQLCKAEIPKLMDAYNIDTWVNTAGLSSMADKRGDSNFTEDDFRGTFEVNFSSTMLLTEIVAAEMLTRNVKGTIINVASMAAYHQTSFHSPYSMSKKALISSTQLLAKKYGDSVCISSIAPGGTVSGMTGCVMGSNFARDAGALNRLLMAEEVASTIAIMASPIGKHLNGQDVKVYPFSF